MELGRVFYTKCGHGEVEENVSFSSDFTVSPDITIKDSYCSKCLLKIKENIFNAILDQIFNDFEEKYGKFEEIEVQDKGKCSTKDMRIKGEKFFAEDMRKKSLIGFLMQEWSLLYWELVYHKKILSEEQKDLYEFLVKMCKKYSQDKIGYIRVGYYDMVPGKLDKIIYICSYNFCADITAGRLSSEAKKYISFDPKEFLKITKNTDSQFWINVLEINENISRIKKDISYNEPKLRFGVKGCEERELKEYCKRMDYKKNYLIKNLKKIFSI